MRHFFIVFAGIFVLTEFAAAGPTRGKAPRGGRSKLKDAVQVAGGEAPPAKLKDAVRAAGGEAPSGGAEQIAEKIVAEITGEAPPAQIKGALSKAAEAFIREVPPAQIKDAVQDLIREHLQEGGEISPAQIKEAVSRAAEAFIREAPSGGAEPASSDFDMAGWKSRLKASSWRDRKNAVSDNELAAFQQSDGKTFRAEVIQALSPMLADSSQAVREAAAEALREWGAAPAADSDTKIQVIMALTKPQKRDSHVVFLKKIELAGAVFLSADLFPFGENMVAIELARPGWVKTVESAYAMIEAGLNPKKSLEARLAAAGFLDQALARQFDQYTALIRKNSIQSPSSMDSAAVFVIEVMADLALEGMGAAKKAARDAGSKPLARALAKTLKQADLLFFQMIEESANGAGWPQWIYPKPDHSAPDYGAAEQGLENYERPWAVIKAALEKGFLSSDPRIRKRAAALAERFGGMYPQLQGRLIDFLKSRQSKESSLSLKTAIKKAVKRVGCKSALQRGQ